MLEPSTCQFYPPSDYANVLECGYLTVPEDRTQPGSRVIRLHVAIFRTRSSNPAPDPVIHLSGGPGSSASDLIWYHFQQGEGRILEQRDYIFFDQRGTGHSEPSLACPEADDAAASIMTQEITLEETNAIEVEAMLRCRDRLVQEGINLHAYNSAASAADVNDLRIALGYDQINLYGVSYGTRLALTVMRDYPGVVRSVILDSAYPPQANLYADWSANAERAFGELFAACASDPACSSQYPNLEATVYQLVDQLNANPVSVPVTLANQREVRVILSGDLLIDVVFSALYRPDKMIYVPRMITDIQRGYYSPFLQERLARYFDRSTSRGVQASVQCFEEIPFSTYDEVLAAAQGVEPHIAHNYTVELASLYTICKTWGSGTAGSHENQPVRSELPTLILAGQFDPITPPAWGQLTAQSLSQVYYYEFPSAGHWVMRSGPCPLDVAMNFLNNPYAPPDASCMTAISPPEFAP